MKRSIAAPFVALFFAFAAHAEDKLPADITPPKPANAHTITRDDYPEISRALHETGSVILKITINTDGHVSDPEVVQSSGFPRLDQAAAETVTRSWLYTPATKDGKPMTVRTEVRVNFLQDQTLPALNLPPNLPVFVVTKGPKDYPQSALAAKETAYVSLVVMVNEKGETSVMKIADGGAPPDLVQATIDAVKSWHLKPAEWDGKPVRSVIIPMFVWSLQEQPPPPDAQKNSP
ncbi:MAG TPA: energy transducer TonB [Rhizomicrobium sp.]|nr:energy transducer TonB [Rhizomicrobium sp.]